MFSLASYQSHPLQTLGLAFLAWKGFLLAVTLGSTVADGYDTSATLLFDRLHGPNCTVPTLATRLTTWDAIYFVYASKQGYVYEQQWAFGTGMTLSMRYLAQFFQRLGLGMSGLEALAGITISHVSHLISVLALHKTTFLITQDRRISFISAFLCIIAPGGLFLSAPNAESTFTCLAFIGTLLFVLGHQTSTGGLKKGLYMIASGVSIGLGTTFRSNGLSYGLLFAFAAVQNGLEFITAPAASSFFELVGALIGGVCIAAGSIIPQAVAWMTYCGALEGPYRPWCSKTIPSIYAFVQDYYWDVGFLRYWTVNQLPLFILAAPMLTVLIFSGWELLVDPERLFKSTAKNPKLQIVLRLLAANQALVAILALTTYHVQIITRLATGYPVWYLWVASSLCSDKRRGIGRGLVVFMVMYAGIQGVLFASFLPPA